MPSHKTKQNQYKEVAKHTRRAALLSSTQRRLHEAHEIYKEEKRQFSRHHALHRTAAAGRISGRLRAALVAAHRAHESRTGCARDYWTGARVTESRQQRRDAHTTPRVVVAVSSSSYYIVSTKGPPPSASSHSRPVEMASWGRD